MSVPKISAVIIARNEEAMIANCIDTLHWCEEILVVDHGSSDNTTSLAKHQGAKVISAPTHATFADLRNLGMEEATGEWLLYVDADERVTPALMRDIKHVIDGSFQQTAYRVARNNIHYGHWMKFGGWQHDKLVRLFRADSIKTWDGRVHEHAEIVGEVGDLVEPLIHLTHRNMADGIRKSLEWTDVEARLLLEAKHPPITALRLIKIIIWDFLHRVFVLKAHKDGMEGMVEAMVQSWNRFLVYERLWELQKMPSLEETYDKFEKDVAHLWDKERV